MAQVKIFGNSTFFEECRDEISSTIHSCLVDALELPSDKRFHRFVPMEERDFIYPSDRSNRYVIIEIHMFSGRSPAAKKRLIHLIFQRLQDVLKLDSTDVEITIIETPKGNWGIRGVPGDELDLPYDIEI